MSENPAPEGMNTEIARASRPEFAPDRKPQALARNFDRAILQAAVIAANPTDNQIRQVVETTEPGQIMSGVEPQEYARNTFGNFLSLKGEYDASQGRVRAARSEALGAKATDFGAKKEALAAAIEARREAKAALNEAVGLFREVGLQVEPSQQQGSRWEAVLQGASVVGYEGARAVAGAAGTVRGGIEGARSGIGRAGRATAEGGKRAGRASIETARRTGRGAKEAGREVGTRVGGNVSEAFARAQRIGESMVRTGREGIESAKSLGREALETGRRAVRGVVAEARRSVDIESAKQAVINEWNTIKGFAEQAKVAAGAAIVPQVESAKSGIGRILGGIGERLGGARERVGEALGPSFSAAGAFKDRVIAGVSEKIPSGEDISKALTSARESAGRRLDSFMNGMREAGQKVGRPAEAFGKGVAAFAEKQAQRATEATNKVTNRVKLEVATVIGKGGILFEGARQAVQSERVKVQERNQVWGEKLGIVVEGVSDVATPILDRILDKGRDVRDGALGFTGKQIEGLRKMGRGVAKNVSETTSPHWNALAERFEALRLRSNEARGRLNALISEKVGPQAARFGRLKESVDARAKRAGEIVSGVTVVGGKILQGGREAPQNIREWMVNAGTGAKEFLKQNLEAAGKTVEAIRRYTEIYALGFWKEKGLSDIDISDRMKLLRGLGAASAERVGKLAARGTAEGIEVVNFLTRDNRGRLLLGAAGLLVLAVCQNDNVSGFLNGVSIPDISPNVSDMGVGGFDGVQAPAAPGFTGVETVAPPSAGTENIISASAPPEAGLTAAQAPSTAPEVVAAPASAPSPGPEVSNTGPAPVGESSNANLAPDTAGFVSPQSSTGTESAQAPGTQSSAGAQANAPTGGENVTELPGGLPRAGESLVNPDLIQKGQMVYPQAERIAAQLPGGATVENVTRVMAEFYSRFQPAFEASAQTMVNNPANFTPEQVSIAQQQLDAIATLKSNPLAAQDYGTVSKAVHFWSP